MSTSTKQLSPAFVGYFEWLCKQLAIFAGFVLVLMSISTVVSVLGRYFFDAPIVGDSEIVKMLTGVAVSLCLPYCHLKAGNVIVDVFTAGISERKKTVLDFLGSLMLTILAFILAWQSAIGAIDVYGYGNETMMLRLKEWWFYIVISAGLFLLSFSGLIVCWRHIVNFKNS